MADPALGQENPRAEPETLRIGNVDEPITGLNLDAELGSGTSSKVRINEDGRLTFAKQVLFWLVLICIGVFVGYACYPENEALEQIFEII